MSQYLVATASRIRAVITAAGDRAAYRFLEFFTARNRNPKSGT